MLNIDLGSKRAQSLKRAATYFLSTVFVIGFTVTLVLATLGYDIDPGTGQVIQNGLVLVNSEPSGASVRIDGHQESDSTPGRFSLPAGAHTVDVDLAGYQPWSKAVTVIGSEVVWLYYPLLIPENANSRPVTSLKNLEFVSQVPDGQRLLLRERDDTTSFRLATVSKTSITNEEVITVPGRTFTRVKDQLGKFSFGGWAKGNDYFLIRHSNSSVIEYVLVNVNNPEESINLTERFDLPLRRVRFFNDKFDQLYAVVNGDLRRIDLDSQTITAPLAQGVAKYVLHTDRFVLFLNKAADDGAQIGLIEGDDKPRIIQTLPRSPDKYMIEFAEYDDEFHLAVMDTVSGRVSVSFNPHQDRNDPPLVIGNPGGELLSFSRNGRFVMTQARNKFALYDFDEERRYTFALGQELPQDYEVRWLDGHRLVFQDTDNNLYITEFDGENSSLVGAANPNFDIFISDSQRVIYWIGQPSKSGVSILRGLDLIAENQ